MLLTSPSDLGVNGTSAHGDVTESSFLAYIITEMKWTNLRIVYESCALASRRIFDNASRSLGILN